MNVSASVSVSIPVPVTSQQPRYCLIRRIPVVGLRLIPQPPFFLLERAGTDHALAGCCSEGEAKDHAAPDASVEQPGESIDRVTINCRRFPVNRKKSLPSAHCRSRSPDRPGAATPIHPPDSLRRPAAALALLPVQGRAPAPRPPGPAAAHGSLPATSPRGPAGSAARSPPWTRCPAAPPIAGSPT